MATHDVAKLAEAVTREVQATERDGKPARVVLATRIYETDLDDAWDAMTNPKRLSRWFLPIEGDLKLGGRYQLRGNASGTITVCQPPRQLAATWEYGGEVTWLEVSLESVGRERTRLTLRHTAHVDDARWAEFGPGAVGVGWALGLIGLEFHISSKGAATPEEGQAWAAAEDGKQFQRLSSDDWARASIAAGTDAAQARAAAARTNAAYTGA